MTAQQIIKKFGGIRPMAKALGHSFPSKVQYWDKINRIPKLNQGDVLAAAKKKKLRITAIEIAKACGVA